MTSPGPRSSKTKKDKPAIDPATMNVLIVDDMENMTKSIRGMLKVLKYGRRFFFAYNGLEAWNLLKKIEEPIDLAIIDWNMPKMTGVELLGHIRDDRKWRDLPIVMVTAESNRGIVAEAAESDIDAYILKPLTVKSLGDKISQVIERANNPPPMFYHLKKARAFEENGDLEGAIKESRLAMEADPLSSKPVRELGYYYNRMGDMASAEKWLKKAVEMNKLDVFAHHHLGEIYLKQDDIENAAIHFDAAMLISPRHVARAVYFGKVLVRKNMAKKAEKVFKAAIKNAENSMALAEEIADFCMEFKVYPFAVKIYETLVRQAPSRSDILFKLGLIFEKSNEPKRALAYLMQAEKQEPKNIDIKLHLAKNQIAMGQILRADQILGVILQADPQNEEARKLLKQCL